MSFDIEDFKLQLAAQRAEAGLDPDLDLNIEWVEGDELEELDLAVKFNPNLHKRDLLGMFRKMSTTKLIMISKSKDYSREAREVAKEQVYLRESGLAKQESIGANVDVNAANKAEKKRDNMLQFVTKHSKIFELKRHDEYRPEGEHWTVIRTEPFEGKEYNLRAPGYNVRSYATPEETLQAAMEMPSEPPIPGPKAVEQTDLLTKLLFPNGEPTGWTVDENGYLVPKAKRVSGEEIVQAIEAEFIGNPLPENTVTDIGIDRWRMTFGGSEMIAKKLPTGQWEVRWVLATDTTPKYYLADDLKESIAIVNKSPNEVNWSGQSSYGFGMGDEAFSKMTQIYDEALKVPLTKPKLVFEGNNIPTHNIVVDMISQSTINPHGREFLAINWREIQDVYQEVHPGFNPLKENPKYLAALYESDEADGAMDQEIFNDFGNPESAIKPTTISDVEVLLVQNAFPDLDVTVAVDAEANSPDDMTIYVAGKDWEIFKHYEKDPNKPWVLETDGGMFDAGHYASLEALLEDHADTPPTDSSLIDWADAGAINKALVAGGYQVGGINIDAFGLAPDSDTNFYLLAKAVFHDAEVTHPEKNIYSIVNDDKGWDFLIQKVHMGLGTQWQIVSGGTGQEYHDSANDAIDALWHDTHEPPSESMADAATDETPLLDLSKWPTGTKIEGDNHSSYVYLDVPGSGGDTFYHTMPNPAVDDTNAADYSTDPFWQSENTGKKYKTLQNALEDTYQHLSGFPSESEDPVADADGMKLIKNIVGEDYDIESTSTDLKFEPKDPGLHPAYSIHYDPLKLTKQYTLMYSNANTDDVEISGHNTMELAALELMKDAGIVSANDVDINTDSVKQNKAISKYANFMGLKFESTPPDSHRIFTQSGTYELVAIEGDFTEPSEWSVMHYDLNEAEYSKMIVAGTDFDSHVLSAQTTNSFIEALEYTKKDIAVHHNPNAEQNKAYSDKIIYDMLKKKTEAELSESIAVYGKEQDKSAFKVAQKILREKREAQGATVMESPSHLDTDKVEEFLSDMSPHDIVWVESDSGDATQIIRNTAHDTWWYIEPGGPTWIYNINNVIHQIFEG